MPHVDILNMEGAKVGDYELSDEIFGIEPNESALHAAVVQYLANRRLGTKSAKTRAEVSGSGIKPRPQKGTGQSRQGSKRSPQWVGGGIVFAPKPRDFSKKVNKKVKRLAMKSAFSVKAADNHIIILDNLAFGEIKTKLMTKVMKSLNIENALFIVNESDRNVALSARNIPGIKTAPVNAINVYDILKYDALVLTKDAADKAQEAYA